MPEIVFDTQDAIPEGLRETATQKDGKFVINVVAASKLDEFRNNNVALAKERDTLKGVVETLKPVIGDDPNAFLTTFNEMKGTVQQVQDGKLKGTDAIEAEVNNRVSAMKTGFENQQRDLAQRLAAAEQKAADTDLKWRRGQVERAVTEAVVNENSGALPSALTDILSRAYGVFHVGDDGKLVAKDGDAVIYGSDGATPMTPIEWMAKLREQAPYFFKSSNGGGAANGGGTNNGMGGLSKEEFAKLSPQAKLNLARKMGAKK